MNVPQFIQSNKHIMDVSYLVTVPGILDGVLNSQGLCNKCGEHKAVVYYENRNYCNWYCAKKGDK